MDAIDRLDRIRTALASDGRVRVDKLAAKLRVSEMTVRRDLDLLAERGELERVRGGATPAGPQPFVARYGRGARAKQRIATKLRSLVDDTDAIGIDASSTMQRLAVLLHDVHDVTAITNGPDSFASLRAHRGVTALLSGGRLDPRTGSLVGPLATRAARDMLLRRFFVSAAGIDPALGTTEATLEEAEVKLAFADVAQELVVAVDASKLGRRGAARCVPIQRIDVLVTDLDADDARLDPYREQCRDIR
jgi:DeoR family fructose operon transcriptional repressor